MFFSPIITQEQRSQGAKNLLDGNIFSEKDMRMHNDVYKSLL